MDITPVVNQEADTVSNQEGVTGLGANQEVVTVPVVSQTQELQLVVVQ